MLNKFKEMNIDQGAFIIAGALIVITLILGVIISPIFLWLNGLLGLDMIQAPITKICPVAMLCKKLGLKPGNIFN